MHLSTYLKQYRIPLKELAELAGISYQTLWHLRKGRNIQLSVAVKIQIATRNRVTCLDLYEEFIEDLERDSFEEAF